MIRFFALHKIFKLKHRYVFTRSHHVRLRYQLGICAAFAGLMLPAMASLPSSVYLQTGAKSESYAESEINKEVREILFNDKAKPDMRLTAQSVKKPSPVLNKSIEIEKGQTVAGVLQEAGLSGEESFHTVKALGRFVDLRSIQAGQTVKVHFKPGPDDSVEFQKLSMEISPIKELDVVKKNDEQFVTSVKEKELKDRVYAKKARVENSLYGSGLKAGIPEKVIANLIRTYSWTVDFQRELRTGDSIEVLYEAKETLDGQYQKTGDVLFAKLSIRGREIPIYRYKTKDGRIEYFGEDGSSIKNTLMKTPIDGARISSGFGMRKHPILGYTKMHKGMDFAAPTGTPIYAAGDGVVEFVGKKNGYGNFITLRHNGKLKTAYAHMQRFASNISNGKRVKQGQVIGYVGTTGRSTGPHLHYEVLVNNKQVNPKSVDLPTGEQLAGAELKAFKSHVASMKQKYKDLIDGVRVAQKETSADLDEDSVYFIR